MTTQHLATGSAVTVRHTDGFSTYDVNATVIEVTAGGDVVVDDGLGDYKVPACDVTVIKAAPVEPATAPEPLPDAPQYGKLHVSDPQAEVLAYAVAMAGGVIRQGRGKGKADVRMLNAMKRRGFITLTHKMVGTRKVITGGVVTPLGARRVTELNTQPAPIPVGSLAA